MLESVYEPSSYPCALMSLNSRPECRYPGLSAEVMGYILKLGAVPYTIFPIYADVTDWGSLDASGTWHGILGLVANGTIDTVVPDYSLVEVRMDSFDFAFQLTTEM